MLGPQFSNWLPRFLRLCVEKRLSQSYDRLVYLVGSHIAENADRIFLRQFSKQTRRYGGGAVKFVEELWTRWTKNRPSLSRPAPLPLPPEAPRGAILVSYASEDFDAAKKLKAGLDSAGLEVWFDKAELQGGDAFALKITRNINRCSFFLPLISQNSVGKRDRFFIKEWNCALERAKGYLEDQIFIIPVVIDQTDINAVAVPAEFRNKQSSTCQEARRRRTSKTSCKSSELRGAKRMFPYEPVVDNGRLLHFRPIRGFFAPSFGKRGHVLRRPWGSR
jgi:TIR domain